MVDQILSKLNLFDHAFYDAFGLMLFMLNPFLLLVYLIDLVEELDNKVFNRAMIRAAFISGIIYLVFAFVGEGIFRNIFKANFASFQIFGGVIFLITGIRFVFEGNNAIKKLRGTPGHIGGGIVLPIMVGPGTISASIITGQKLEFPLAAVAIITALAICVVVLLLLKKIYSSVRTKNEELVLRYIDIFGRISALIIGTFSVEMIMNGLSTWMQQF